MSLSSFKLSIPLKLLFVAIALVFPTVVLLYLLMTEKDKAIDFGTKEIYGNAYLVPLKNMMDAAPEHMLKHHQKLALGGVDDAELKQFEASLTTSLQSLRSVDQQYGKGFAASQENIENLEKGVKQLTSKTAAMSLTASESEHTQLITKLREVITYFGDQSNLILDPDLDSYYLMDATLLKTPSIVQNLDKLQLLTQKILAKEAASAQDKTDVVVLQGLIRSDLDALRTDIDTTYANTLKPEEVRQALEKTTTQTQQNVKSYLDYLEKNVRQGNPSKSMLAQTAKLSDTARNSVFALFDASITEENKLLQTRVSGFEQSKIFTVTWVLILIAAFLVLGAFFIYGILQAISALNDAAKRVSEGFMDVNVKVKSGDELEVLAQSFNNMIEQNQQTLMEIEMARSDSENEQAVLKNLVEGTTQSVSEIQTKSEIVSDNARIVAEAAAEATSVSSEGEQAVSESIEGVNKIKAQIESVAEKILELSSRTQAIGEITATVDDISQQSKFLAFNASIEASKAGEFGKGFAIVANEIKNLSEESKDATEKIAAILTEIQGLTNTSVMLAEDATKLADIGVDLSNKAGESITQLVFSIENSAEAAYQISSSAMEQQNDLAQLADKMQQLVKGA